MFSAATALSGGMGGGLGIVIGLGIGFAVIGALALVAFLVVRAKGDTCIDSAYHHSRHHSGTCCH